MIVTITSKGQITIPLSLRQKFHLKAGDKLDFDENAPVLVARRAVDQKEWAQILKEWKKSARTALKGHPWENRSSSGIMDDLRNGAADSIPEKP
jgi:AbrB family looped-hinge helix DNA binding protein